MSLEVISVIDIDPSQPYISVVHCKQYDTVRMVEAHLYTDGVKWYVPTNNIYAMVQYRKTDHIGGFYDIVDDPTEAGGSRAAVSVNSGDRSIIYISIAQEVLTTYTPPDADGTTVEVVFYDTVTNARLGLFQFYTKVEEASIREVDLSSNPYFNVLAQQIKAVLDAESKLTGLTADSETLAPDDEAYARVDGGTGPDDPYVITLGIPSMPGMTATATKLAPNATPTAEITGGTEPYEDFNIALGIPSMTSFTASASQLATTADPTAVVSGGQTAGQAFNIAFGIPKGNGIVSITSKYGESADDSTLPTTWVDHVEDLTIPDGHIGWTKNIALCEDGNTYLSYAKALQGFPGPPGVAVQDTEPETTVKVWINPDETATPIVIPEYTDAEDATIHNIGGIMLTTVKTIPNE